MHTVVLTFLFALSIVSAQAQTTTVVQIPSRGQSIRAIVITPPNPIGSVILLVGGQGVMAISPEGKIGWGAGNQVIRTRASYAAAGFVTIGPDAAPDMGTPQSPKSGYRFSPQHGQDLAAVVAYARGVKAPVTIVGTSRGAVSAGILLAQASGPGRPDAMVLTAPMLMTVGNQPSFQKTLNNSPAKAQLPFLVVGHKKDQCEHTAPPTIEAFRQWHGGKLDIIFLDGPQGTGDPCEAQSAHGFAGIDGTVVSTVTNWIKGRK